MRARWITTFAIAGAASLALVAALRAPTGGAGKLVASTTTPAETRVAAHANAQPSDDATEPVSTTRMTDVVLDQDIIARLATIEAAVRDDDRTALPALLVVDLSQEPEAAPAIIHAVATLGVHDRALAGKTLARWLRAESDRKTRDADGNVVSIIEALGELGGDEAVTALVDALDREGMLDLPLQTTAVERLGALGDRRALAAIDRFAVRVAKLPPSDDTFERELQTEASAAAIAARTRLGR